MHILCLKLKWIQWPFGFPRNRLTILSCQNNCSRLRHANALCSIRIVYLFLKLRLLVGFKNDYYVNSDFTAANSSSTHRMPSVTKYINTAYFQHRKAQYDSSCSHLACHQYLSCLLVDKIVIGWNVHRKNETTVSLNEYLTLLECMSIFIIEYFEIFKSAIEK